MNLDVERITGDEYMRKGIGLLGQTIADSFFAPNRAIDPSIRRIYLGEFAPVSAELSTLSATELNPEIEYSKVGYLKPLSDRFEIEGPFRGIENRVDTELSAVRFRIAGDRLRSIRQNRFVGLRMHSHGVDQVSSPTDVLDLLLADSEVFCPAATMTVTPLHRYLTFRGPDSPQMSRSEIVSLQNSWYVAAAQSYTTAEKAIRELGRTEADKIHQLFSEIVLNAILKKYGLIMFNGLLKSHYLDKAELS